MLCSLFIENVRQFVKVYVTLHSLMHIRYEGFSYPWHGLISAKAKIVPDPLLMDKKTLVQ